MPELAEVEFFRKRWHQAAAGRRIEKVRTHPAARVFRSPAIAGRLRADLTGAVLRWSAAAGKQMCFRFGEDCWLGLHLGMSGELTVGSRGFVPGRHDHLVLYTAGHALIFTDPRKFGAIEYHRGAEAPTWWTRIAPSILSAAFTPAAVQEFLARRRRSPIKAVLLMQERFPGIGNWMADEILWRAAIHPKRLAGELDAREVRALWRACRVVCRQALVIIAGRGENPPEDLNARIPDSWLFNHRWRAGGLCPRTGVPLRRETVGGRTTCWSPARQLLHPTGAKRSRG